MEVNLVVYDRKAFKIDEKLLKSVRAYIDDKYVEDMKEKRALLYLEKNILYEDQASSHEKLGHKKKAVKIWKVDIYIPYFYP